MSTKKIHQVIDQQQKKSNKVNDTSLRMSLNQQGLETKKVVTNTTSNILNDSIKLKESKSRVLELSKPGLKLRNQINNKVKWGNNNKDIKKIYEPKNSKLKDTKNNKINDSLISSQLDIPFAIANSQSLHEVEEQQTGPAAAASTATFFHQI